MQQINQLMNSTVSFRDLALGFFLFLPAIFAINYFLVRYAVKSEFKKHTNEK